MRLPDSRAKRALRTHVPALRYEERQIAAYVSRAPFRQEYLVTRRQVARYVTARRAVLFGPDFPHADTGYSIVKVLLHLGVRATSAPSGRPPEAVFAWLDTTIVSPDHAAALVSAYGRVINARCVDIGKDRVEEVHQSVFGYGMAVDPREGGTYVRKSVTNALHDARVLDTATEPEPGYVYQRLIQQRSAKRFVEEIRLPYVGACLPVCMLKLKVNERRFEGMPQIHELEALAGDRTYGMYASAVPLELVYSADEVARIDRFAQALGLDYGELDIVRDGNDGRIYVLDANKTPVGPTIALGPRDMRRYLDAYAEAAQALISRFSVC